jgi:uncharacterized protein HemY
LAYFYAEKYPTPANLEKAVKIMTGIPEQFLDARILDTLGWVYYKKKDYQNAKTTLEQVLAKSETQISQFHLALVYLKLNQKEKAKELLNKALAEEGKGLPENEKKIALAELQKL